MIRSGRILSAALAAAICITPFQSAFALDYDSYDDYDDIVSHVNLSIPQELTFTRPSQSFTTSASAYYLTGNSSPTQDLYLNGTKIENRGMYGSFGVYVGLEQGANVFTLEQGGKQVSVTITRGSVSPTITTTRVLTKAFPTYDVGYRAGDVITLSCTAPAGSSVTARVGSAHIQLQQVASASKGVPAVFRGTVTAGTGSGATESIGSVTYTLSYDGAVSTYTSAGDIIVAGNGNSLAVQIADPSATVFDRESTNGSFVTTAKRGGVDTVTEIGDNMYKLRMGGWVLKSAAQPLTYTVNPRVQVGAASFHQGEKGERFVLEGGSPLFAAYQDSTKLHLRLYNTTGLSDLPVEESSLYSSVNITEEEGDTLIDLNLRQGAILWGYVVEYEDGALNIYSKYKPSLSSGSQPLSGVNVVLDPGHGGIDSGALGIARLTGAMEKDINLANAVAVKKRLESLGAHVSMVRDTDVNPSLNQRLQYTKDADADIFIALHCNSLVENSDGTKPNGVEVYYYEGISKTLATALAQNISSATGRSNRGAKYSNFKVTLNSYAPSVLVEMAFLTNPWEYDNLRSKDSIYYTANAVADSILTALA